MRKVTFFRSLAVAQWKLVRDRQDIEMVLHSGFPLPRTVLQNLLWLAFALSFLWFPYIGMVTFPCRRNPASDRKRASSRSSYVWGIGGSPAHVDYSKIGMPVLA